MSKKDDPKLAALASAVDDLDAATDRTNEEIGEFEDELARLGVGVAVWLSTQIESSARRVDRSGPGRHESQDYWRVGYSKIGDSWHVAAKRVREIVGFAEGNDPDSMFTDVLDVDQPIPLLSAPRNVRIIGYSLRDDLVEALTERAMAMAKRAPGGPRREVTTRSAKPSTTKKPGRPGSAKDDIVIAAYSAGTKGNVLNMPGHVTDEGEE